MKRLSLSILIAVLITGIALSGCVSVDFASAFGNGVAGSGSMEKYTFKTGEIKSIKIEMHCDIHYYSAPSDEVTLQIQPNLIDYIIVEESGGALSVRSTNQYTISGKAPVLTVSSPALASVTLLGAGAFTAHDAMVADSISLTLAGAGSGSAEVDAEHISVSVSGAGDMKLSGKAETADMTLSGAGNLDAMSMRARDASVNLSGAGTIKVNCTDNLRVNADGLGTVEYKGSPATEMNTSGLVSVKKVG